MGCLVACCRRQMLDYLGNLPRATHRTLIVTCLLVGVSIDPSFDKDKSSQPTTARLSACSMRISWAGAHDRKGDINKRTLRRRQV